MLHLFSRKTYNNKIKTFNTMNHISKYLVMAALAVPAVLTSCADRFDQNFKAGNPEKEGYEYLEAYAPLKEYVDHAKYPNFKLGCGATATEYLKGQMVYALTNSNFEEVVTGNAMKYASCVSETGSMNFSTVTDFVNMATDAGLYVYGHTLAWHAQQQPAYLNGLLKDRPIPVDPSGQVEEIIHECDYSQHSAYPWYRMSELPQVEDGILVITNDNPTLADWQVQYFVDDGCPTTVGGDYIVRVTIKGSSEGSLNCNVGDWGGQASCRVSFSDEWETKDFKVSGVPAASSFVVFQSGGFVGTIMIKDVKLVQKKSAGPAKYWESVIDNGDMEGDNANAFAKKENSGSIVYEIAPGVGKDGSRGVKIASNGGQATAWESQFWIVSKEEIKVGTKCRISFDYRADGGAVGTSVDTQAHYGPGEYQFWSCAGSVAFTSEWKTFEKTFTVDESMGGTPKAMKSVAFNMSPNSADGNYYIDNVVFEVEKESEGGGIPLTPEEKKDTLIWAMDNWVRGMMDACVGKVHAFDLINEAVAGGDMDGDGLYDLQHSWNVNEADAKNNFYWQDYFGDEDYGRIMARLAREYGPEDVKLFINDYNLESWWDDNGKAKSLVKWIEKWEADGVTKIDGIGTQMHISCYDDETSLNNLKASIEGMYDVLVASHKLIRVSEFDMGYCDKAFGKEIPTSELSEDQLHKMAEFWKWNIETYLKKVPVDQQWGFCAWATTDSPAGSGWRPDQPLGLWDLQYYRKHAYAGFADGLAGK